MKLQSADGVVDVDQSLSSWRAWIEIFEHADDLEHRGRSPHGERGLKLVLVDGVLDVLLSLSSWRAWIEIHLVLRGGRELSLIHI